MSVSQGTPSGNNGLVLVRGQGNPVLFDGQGTNLNLGSSRWVTLFDLSSFTDRIFTGLSLYNKDSTNRCYVAFTDSLNQGTPNEVKSMVIEPGADLSLDQMCFGPGFLDPWSKKKTVFVRALLSATGGTAASATMTKTGNFTNGMQFTLGANTYTFQSKYSNASPYNVPIGATLAISLTNLVAAVNAADFNVFASTSATVFTITANYIGTGMNTYVFVDVSTGAVFTGSGVLASGAGGSAIDCMIW